VRGGKDCCLQRVRLGGALNETRVTIVVKAAKEDAEPVRLGAAVVVGERDKRPLCRTPADVALPRGAPRPGLDGDHASASVTDEGVLLQCLLHLAHVVVDDNDLEGPGIEILVLECVEQPPQAKPPAMRRHDDADLRARHRAEHDTGGATPGTRHDGVRSRSCPTSAS
jgi:hypothetical protein